MRGNGGCAHFDRKHSDPIKCQRFAADDLPRQFNTKQASCEGYDLEASFEAW
jgi:hypothetical protein